MKPKYSNVTPRDWQQNPSEHLLIQENYSSANVPKFYLSNILIEILIDYTSKKPARTNTKINPERIIKFWFKNEKKYSNR